MYIKDLSRYSYIFKIDNSNEYNVGWLSKDHEFTKGEIPNKEKFLKLLNDYIKYKVNQTAGYCNCEFCDKNTPLADIGRSSNEIRVVGKDGKVYASPSMIIHYIDKHNYLPPQEFIDAVLNGPNPDSKEYKDIVEEAMYKDGVLKTISGGYKFDINNKNHKRAIDYLKSIGKISENKILKFNEFNKKYE